MSLSNVCQISVNIFSDHDLFVQMKDQPDLDIHPGGCHGNIELPCGRNFNAVDAAKVHKNVSLIRHAATVVTMRRGN